MQLYLDDWQPPQIDALPLLFNMQVMLKLTYITVSIKQLTQDFCLAEQANIDIGKNQ